MTVYPRVDSSKHFVEEQNLNQVHQNAIILPRPQYPDLLIGIYLSSTDTTALLARKKDVSFEIIGRGHEQPFNPLIDNANFGKGLQQAIDMAFAAASIENGTVDCVCLGFESADRQNNHQKYLSWAERLQLAARVCIASGTDLVLAAGSEEGWGFAIIAGTGSSAYGKNATGVSMHTGGWGPLLGNSGSAYSIALEALQTACVEIDLGANLNDEAMSRENALWPIIQETWQLKSPAEFSQKVCQSDPGCTMICSLAPAILSAYFAGNSDAAEVVEHQAMSLAGDAAIILRKLFRSVRHVPIVLSGELFTNFARYQEMVVDDLKRCLTTKDNPQPIGKVTIVSEPARGAVRLASQLR